MTTKQIEVEVKVGQNPDGSDKTVSDVTSTEVFETIDDILEKAEEADETGVKTGLTDLLKWINAQVESYARMTLRNKLIRQNAGPEKSIEKAVNQLIKAREAVGKPISEEKARQIVMTMMNGD